MSKGQVTIPKHIRRRQGIRAGSEVEFAERGATIVVTKAAPRSRAARSDQEFAAYLERVTVSSTSACRPMSSCN